MRCFTDYRYIFGKPGEGVHKHRLAGSAAIDYIMSIIGAIILSYITDIPLVISTIFILFLGIVLHSAVGISTGATRFLGMDLCI